MNKLYFISLGCSKNLVDSQVMLGRLLNNNYSVTQVPEEADTIIVNTCSFIGDAKEESINTILKMTDYKKDGNCNLLIVAGCLSQRYSDELKDELPEVDLFVGTGEYQKIAEHIKTYGKTKKSIFVNEPTFIHTENDLRINTSPSYSAWLKVSEGCERNCTYCIIPKIRGGLRSRSIESLKLEVKNLVDSGVREINVISQDLSQYGKDLREQGHKDNVVDLFKMLIEEEKLDWIRPLYYYPDELSIEFINLMKSSVKICNYIDIPIQHFSDNILKRMNRNITGDEILKKIKMLREHLLDITLRTSIIVGFPGETEEDFMKLVDGLKVAKFDHLGVFKYSDEEGTASFNLNDKISQDIIDDRHHFIYELQKEIVANNNKKYIKKEIDVLLEGVHEETNLLLQGRHQGQAPDIDGNVIINDGTGNVGDILKVKITEAHEYDLVGGIV